MIVNSEIFKAQLGGIQSKMNFHTVEPFIKAAEREFRNIVGKELYDFLNEIDLNNPNPDLDLVNLRELLEISQGCISWAAYDLALPQLKIRVGDLGAAKNIPSQTTAITKWEYVDTREANLTMQDIMWEFFWETLEELKPDVWTASESYKRRNQYFLRSADELTSYIALVGRNRRLFAQLERFIRRGEQLYISDAITSGVFDRLKVRWMDKDAELTPVELMLVEKIREALAYLTLHEAYPYLPIKIDENGVRETRKWDGTSNENPADPKYKNAQRQQLWQDAQLYIGRLKTFMDSYATADQFPEYYLANLSEPDQEDEDFTYKSHVLI
ncbi:DUF6712 family protein [Dyadobacter diqingensis]|uniref:DUF6712 family protein n=1 Tax=Dyadobacter diqingensis TaxID=2938121 RepID=UPI0020C39C91|nr:DUF6712 family protein [Dyadobacter diqingensis]